MVWKLSKYDLTLESIRQEQKMDYVCKKTLDYCPRGWPDKNQLPIELIPYIPYKGEFSHADNLLFCNSRLMIPQ